MLKKTLIALLTLVLSITTFGFWFFSHLPDSESRKNLRMTKMEDLDYLKQGVSQSRGKILSVVTSTNVMGNSGKITGYELTELSRAYYVFSANGFEVDIASPEGGSPPVVIDGDDMGAFDYAFLNDPVAQAKVKNSIALDQISASEYAAIYFVGGKGAMFDFPQSTAIQDIVRTIDKSNGVIGAVCHGPAALVNVTLDDGTFLIENKTISAFTNNEELFLIPEARNIFPFLLEDKLVSNGANFNPGPRYLEQISVDGNLVTGQNPWSVWKLAEAMITQLGYTPVARNTTAEENSIDILYAYETRGFKEARELLQNMQSGTDSSVDKTLIAMHSIVALMDWELIKIIDLLRLLNNTSDTRISLIETEIIRVRPSFPIA
ncbi:MAG: type 1 glutamine amidotransferase domain-containing protein [Gammaproteobacteria bacterium]|nr:type 1 glutamine amidotransferase domain-containing protein [Gammaproteobacteria bacterium]